MGEAERVRVVRTVRVEKAEKVVAARTVAVRAAAVRAATARTNSLNSLFTILYIAA